MFTCIDYRGHEHGISIDCHPFIKTHGELDLKRPP